MFILHLKSGNKVFLDRYEIVDEEYVGQKKAKSGRNSTTKIPVNSVDYVEEWENLKAE